VQGYVTHNIVKAYAEDTVNLKRTSATEYREQVARLRERLKTYIDEHPDYGFVKSRHSGSLAKGTALSTLNDMDVAVYVEAGEAPAVEADLLRWMEERLKEALMPLGLEEDQFVRQDHCVKVEYRGSGLNVDVVPVIYEGEDDDVGYLIRKDTGARVKTSVTQHLEFIRKRKSAQPNDFAQVVRLVKWWIRETKMKDDDFRFKSFMAELICAHLADGGLSMADYPDALERFFACIVRTGLEERIAFEDYYEASELPEPSPIAVIEIYDPVNAENNVAAGYMAQDRDRILTAAGEALNALNEAAYAEGKGRAVECWKRLFGPTFKG
jgi:tRNA nucleotidyltransferase (CCA-adding enzyme)